MMQTVYDRDGNAHTVDSVDAREYIAMGGYFSSNPKEKAAVEDKVTKTSKTSKTIAMPRWSFFKLTCGFFIGFTACIKLTLLQPKSQ